MFKTKARSKFLDISRSPKLVYIFLGGVVLTVLSYFLYQNFLVVFTLIACTIALLLILSKKPKEIEVIVDEDGVSVEEDKVSWQKCVAWAVVDLGDDLEFVIQTSQFTKDFYYFYMVENMPETNELMRLLAEYIPYDELLPKRNFVHELLRNSGLR